MWNLPDMKQLWLFVCLCTESLAICASLNDAGSSSGYLLRLKNKAKGMRCEAFLAWFEVASGLFWETPPPANPQPYPLVKPRDTTAR